MKTILAELASLAAVLAVIATLYTFVPQIWWAWLLASGWVVTCAVLNAIHKRRAFWALIGGADPQALCAVFKAHHVAWAVRETERLAVSQERRREIAELKTEVRREFGPLFLEYGLDPTDESLSVFAVVAAPALKWQPIDVHSISRLPEPTLRECIAETARVMLAPSNNISSPVSD